MPSTTDLDQLTASLARLQSVLQDLEALLAAEPDLAFEVIEHVLQLRRDDRQLDLAVAGMLRRRWDRRRVREAAR